MKRLVTVVLLAWCWRTSALSGQDPSLQPDGPVFEDWPAEAHYALPLGGVPADPTADNVRAFFDAAFETQRTQHALAGEVVAVVHGGRLLFAGGYGWADVERRVPADPEETLFRLASITKPFVWTAIMQLAERGQIDLQAPVETYIDFSIPDTFEEPIRVWHLLTHTAGFEETWLGWGARGPGDVDQLGAALEALLPARVRPPGTHAAYSNYGAALAGYIVQRVSSKSWPRYVEDRILIPLGMASTNARTEMRSDLRRRHATGYSLVDGVLRPTPYRWLQLGPAGHMSSTARDMSAFMLAHLGGGSVDGRRILEEGTTRRMHTPLFDPYPELPPLLHGFYRSDRNGRVVFGHGGDLNGFHARLVLLPDADFGLFVAVNSDPGAAALQLLVASFLDHFFGEVGGRSDGERAVASRAPGPGAYSVRPATVALAPYAGEYVPLRNAFTTFESLRQLYGPSLTLGVDGGRLVTPAGGSLVPIGPDRFRTTDGRTAIVFERDGGNRVSHVLVGSPLGTYQRMRGLSAPSRARQLLFLAKSIAWAALLGWGYRLLRPAPEARRLPSPHVRLAWVTALLTATSLTLLPAALTGLTLGLTPMARFVFALLDVGAALGTITAVCSARQWLLGSATVGARLRYASVAAAALVTAWLSWSYHLLGAGFR